MKNYSYKIILGLGIVLSIGLGFATAFSPAAPKIKLLSVKTNLHDQASLQRGAMVFMNYCSGCHSLRYLRYNRMASELGLTTFDGAVDKALLFNNLIFTSAAIDDPIQIGMPAEDARQWFGVIPPDLSLTARQHGASWLYTYLRSFYNDNSRPFKTNNLLIPNVAMPDVLSPLSGEFISVYEHSQQVEKQSGTDIPHLVLISEGGMNQQQFDSLLKDLVNFLVYVGEPVKLVRYSIGIKVILFLFILLVSVYQLKKRYQ